MSSQTLVIDRDVLAEAITAPAGIAPSNATLPILNTLCLQVRRHELTVTGSDLQTDLQTKTFAQGAEIDWAWCVQARPLASIVKSAPSGAMTLTPSDGQGAQRIEVRAGRSRWSLKTLPDDDYPRMETPGDGLVTVEIPAADIAADLGRTLRACAKDDVRFFLNGVLLEIAPDAPLAWVGTDGHRLAVAYTELTQPPAIEQPLALILPRDACTQIARLARTDGTVILRAPRREPHWAELDFGTVVLRTKLIEGRYPDWRRVIPTNHTTEAAIPRNDLTEAVRRVNILSHEQYHGLRLMLYPQEDQTPPTLRIEAANQDGEEASETIEGIGYSGERVMLSINALYLADALASCTDEQVHIGITDSNSASTISETDSPDLQVLMPMRT